MDSQCRYVSEAFINFLLLSAVLFLTSCMSKSFMILFSVSYLWAVLLLSYSGGSGSFITDPSLISTLICMLHRTPIRKAVVLVEMMSFLVRLRENNSFIAFFFFFPSPSNASQQSTTNLAHVDKAFTMHMQCAAVH